MIYGKSSSIPHSYNNQEILRDFGQEITGSFRGRAVRQVKNASLFSQISSFFPSSQTVGSRIGEAWAFTYGAQFSNQSIDFIMDRVFQHREEPASFWSLKGIKRMLFGITEETFTETIKMTLTPKALPYLALFSGAAAGAALPALVQIISSVYRGAMDDPYALKQLAKIPLEELFSLDPETGRLRDAYGRLLSPEDIRDISICIAKQSLVSQIIDLCHAVDQEAISDDVKGEEIKRQLQALVDSYLITREDGATIFQDGSFLTDDDQEVIKKGICDLSRVNPLSKRDNIYKFVNLIAEGSLSPATFLSADDTLFQEGEPRRMPLMFSDDESWKNTIIRASDGKYIIAQTTEIINEEDEVNTKETEGKWDDISTYTLLTKERKKEKGSFVTEEEVCEIFSQIKEARKIKELEQNEDLISLPEPLPQQEELAQVQ